MHSDTVMFMTVGKSLVENVRKREEERNRISLFGVEDKEVVQRYYDKHFESLKACLEDNYRIAPYPSAEIQSLCYWLKNQEQSGKPAALQKVILLPTEEDPAPFCADRLKEILETQVLPFVLARPCRPERNKTIVPEPMPFRLSLQSEQEFSSDISRFLKMLDELIRVHAGPEINVVFNITGGYKGLTPFFSLFGFLMDNIEVIYLHENAEVILRVPTLPLAWDFRVMDEYRSVFQAGGPSRQEPPAKLRAFFEKVGNTWAQNPFTVFVNDIYTRDRTRRFGYGARLIRRLPKELKDRLLPGDGVGGIYRWEHIWIGDQIPETVEHSRGHSQRLMEYAASLLEPRFEQDVNFLSPEELYCLICCLWLHDIGHTALTYQNPPTGKPFPIALFPTLVREYHHFLSYEAILSHEALLSSHELPLNERQAVALISLYHRGKMPLRGRPFEEVGWFGHIAPSIEDRLGNTGLPFLSSTIRPEKAILLCALLKFIDSLDTQRDRVIDTNYFEERRQRTIHEIEYYRMLLERKREHGTAFCCSEARETMDRLIDRIESLYAQWLMLPSSGNEWNEALEIEEGIKGDVGPSLAGAVRCVLEYSEADPGDLMACLEVLSIIDKIGFKMSTHHHFLKHRRVKLVYLTGNPKPNGTSVSYKVRVIFDPGHPTPDEQKPFIVQDICKEMARVRGVLAADGNGIVLEGVFDENGMPLCQEGPAE